MRTVSVRIYPDAALAVQLAKSAQAYIETVNALVCYITGQHGMPRLTTAHFKASLPSCVKNEAIRAAESVVKKYRRGQCQSLPVLKKPVLWWNNQNYQLKGNTLAFPLLVEGKSKRVAVPIQVTAYQLECLEGKLGALRITCNHGKWMAQIAVETTPQAMIGNGSIGVDLGIKVPAVAVGENGATRFFGKGRQNKYMRRKFREARRRIGKAKKPRALTKNRRKENLWMRDQDHKISRGIVTLAKEQGASTIKLEQLSGIRRTARTSRKNEHNLHSWSFYRLAQYIEYKAKLLGIRVEYVDPRYTSQKCPMCGDKNHAKDRTYRCGCGFRAHRDRVGAMNIRNAPVSSGERTTA